MASALLHVVWNAAVRRAEGNLRFVWWLVLGAGVTGAAISGPRLLDPALWRVYPLLLATTVLNGAYYLALGRAYARGDLSWVYPIARGFAVAATAPLAWLALRQPLSPLGWAGLVVVLAGICAMPRPVGVAPSPADWIWPLLVGGCVAGYTLVDGAAVGTAPPLPYAALEYLGAAAVVAPAAVARRGTNGTTSPTPWIALAAGAVSLFSYVLMLYAYRMAPVGMALGLRQVAPSLASLTGALALRERVPARRSLATAAIVAGAVLMVIA